MRCVPAADLGVDNLDTFTIPSRHTRSARGRLHHGPHDYCLVGRDPADSSGATQIVLDGVAMGADDRRTPHVAAAEIDDVRTLVGAGKVVDDIDRWCLTQHRGVLHF